jgi:hypothetical protein
MNVEEVVVVVGPFHSSIAPLQVALLVLQQLKRIDAHILTHNFKEFTHLLSFLLHLDRGGLGILIHQYIRWNNCSNVRNFRERQQHNIVIAIHSRQMVEADQKFDNKILSDIL